MPKLYRCPEKDHKIEGRNTYTEKRSLHFPRERVSEGWWTQTSGKEKLGPGVSVWGNEYVYVCEGEITGEEGKARETNE